MARTNSAGADQGAKADSNQAGGKLGDAELVLLSAAAAREDGLLEPPAGLKPVTGQRAIGALLKRGLLVEMDAGREGPVWREEDGRRLGLRITPAGLAAIEPDGASATETASPPLPAAEPISAAPASVSAQPREGSKGALVIGLLSRPGGAGLDELVAATGWLPHTTRAALTGLRKRGHEVARSKAEDGRSVYRIVLPEPKQTAPSRRGRRAAMAEAARA